ncbi:hypothetical protein QBC46DRAFT_342349 [Diplogelasinospora grovesii]|uniref:Cytochrome P450 n=1 Tax=Diplogelasinospora grovesii TaxID=303347 RepID=A0AAN6N5M5_9PEZI|nr:hypothetical protein QBC46DRAFT_342349 [Diplogelasinospora grovesii]
MLNNGPGNVMLALPVEEGKRSKASQAAKGKVGDWDPEGILKYDPERWLVREKGGGVVFNINAGPTHGFGAGPRACFGRKWANLELKIILLLIIWNFELEPTPEALSSFTAEEGMTRWPKQCYVRLKALP